MVCKLGGYIYIYKTIGNKIGGIWNPQEGRVSLYRNLSFIFHRFYIIYILLTISSLGENILQSQDCERRGYHFFLTHFQNHIQLTNYNLIYHF